MSPNAIKNLSYLARGQSNFYLICDTGVADTLCSLPISGNTLTFIHKNCSDLFQVKSSPAMVKFWVGFIIIRYVIYETSKSRNYLVQILNKTWCISTMYRYLSHSCYRISINRSVEQCSRQVSIRRNASRIM